MTGRVRVFTVRDTPGFYVYVGQCLYVGDDGLSIEHDWLRLSPVGGGDEIWVAPEDASEVLDGTHTMAVAS